MWIRIGNFLNLCLCLILVLCPLKSWAEDTTFEATVNANKVSLRDMVELTLTVHGAKNDVPIVSLPAIDGFDSRFVGPASRFTIINGVTSNEKSLIYNLFPSKTGHFKIPSIPITLDGKTYQTAAIDIDVVEKTDDTSSSGTSEESQDLSSRLFMKAFIDHKDFYVGQKVPLEIKVYVKDLSLQLAAVPSLKPDGFLTDSTANMEKGKDVVDGVSYDSLKFNTNIYPTRTGTIQVGPFEGQGELMYRDKQSEDILTELLSNVRSRPTVLHANPISMHVLPLPEEGKPADFSGAVGQYFFKVSVGPSTVKLGDPLTLKMTINGDGRIKDLVMPTFSDSHFKTYDPKIKDEENYKTFEQVIIPTDKDITEVGALHFSYFDPQDGKYKTITQGPFPIKVLPPSASEEFKAYGFVDKSKSTGDKTFVLKLDGIKGLLLNILKTTKSMVMDLKFWLLLIAIGVVWFGIKIYQDFQKRLQDDEAFAREWKADSKAKELVKATKGYLQSNKPKDFYSSLNKTLNDYLADKMHAPVAGLNFTMIESYLTKRSADPAKISAIKDLFDRCDLARFASASISSDQMAQDLQQLEDLINYLSKILK